MRASECAALVAVAVGLLCAPPLPAQSARSGSDDARLMQQLQQLAGERSTLLAENAGLKAQLEAAKRELAGAAGEKGALERRARSAEAEAARAASSGHSAEEQLGRTRSQLDELIGKFRETAGALREIELDRNTLRSQLTAAQSDLDRCVVRNAGLYDIGAEALERLESQGFWSSLADAEPFTRVRRTRLENLIDQDRERAAALRIAPPAAP